MIFAAMFPPQSNQTRVRLIEDTTTTIIDLTPWIRVVDAFDQFREDAARLIADLMPSRLALDLELEDFRKATTREELRAKWTREALERHRAAERRRRELDPSELEAGEFRCRARACGSSWRVTLR